MKTAWFQHGKINFKTYCINHYDTFTYLNDIKIRSRLMIDINIQQ